jgi:hypothetical protein
MLPLQLNESKVLSRLLKTRYPYEYEQRRFEETEPDHDTKLHPDEILTIV